MMIDKSVSTSHKQITKRTERVCEPGEISNELPIH